MRNLCGWTQFDVSSGELVKQNEPDAGYYTIMKTKHVSLIKSAKQGGFSVGLLLCVALCLRAYGVTEEEVHKQFSVKPGGTIVVDVGVGGITVDTNGTGQVVVDVKRKVGRRTKAEEQKYLTEYPVEITQDGDKVIVRCQKQKTHGSFTWKQVNEATYTITVPAQFNAKLMTAGGPISVNDLTGEVKADTSGGGLHFARIHGPLKGETSGGPIHVSDCEGEQKVSTSGGGIDVAGGGGSLSGSTSGGSVAVRNFHGPADVETSGGGITLERVAGKINGDTSGGGINAVLVAPLPGPVKLSTSGGGIKIKVPGDAAFDLDAETSAGSVNSELPVTVTGKLRRDHLRGPVNGGGKPVVLRTSAGSIHIIKSEATLKAEAEK